MAAEELDALQSRFDDCSIVAFADISTKMILVTNSDNKADQAELHQLCAEASTLLSGDGKPALGTLAATSAVRRTGNETLIFVRSPSEPNDVLISVCASSVDISKFVPEAMACLDKI